MVVNSLLSPDYPFGQGFCKVLPFELDDKPERRGEDGDVWVFPLGPGSSSVPPCHEQNMPTSLA